jgi:hypothetical protein
MMVVRGLFGPALLGVADCPKAEGLLSAVGEMRTELALPVARRPWRVCASCHLSYQISQKWVVPQQDQ